MSSPTSSTPSSPPPSPPTARSTNSPQSFPPHLPLTSPSTFHLLPPSLSKISNPFHPQPLLQPTPASIIMGLKLLDKGPPDYDYLVSTIESPSNRQKVKEALDVVRGL